MNSQAKVRLFYGGINTLFFSLFFIFILLDKNERTVPLILLAIGISVICNWFGSLSFSRILKKQFVLNDRIELELKKGEELIAESMANYKICGGKLIITNVRLCYVRMLFHVEKTIIDIPITSILEVQVAGRKKLDITTLDKIRYSYRLEDAQIFAQKIRILKFQDNEDLLI